MSEFEQPDALIEQGALKQRAFAAPSQSNLITALAKAQAEMTHASMDAENPHFKSRYASLGAVIDAVRGPLTSQGIAFIQHSKECQDGVAIETVFYLGDESLATGEVVIPVDKLNAHGYGSALTYAKRYSLAMACGISAELDDDGNTAVENAPRSQSVRQTVLDQSGGVNASPKSLMEFANWVRACIEADDRDQFWVIMDQIDEIEKEKENFTIAVYHKLNTKERAQWDAWKKEAG